MRKGALRADMLLLIAAGIWGSGFIAQRAAMESMGPWVFNTLRYGIGAVLVLPWAWKMLGGRLWSKPVWRDGATLGLVLGVGAGLQQIGMVTTTASRAGFLTGLYVLLVPIIGLLMRQRPGVGHLVGLALAGGGLFLFSPDMGEPWVVGDIYVLCGACVWALHVVLAGITTKRSDPVALAGIQFAVAGVCSGVVMAVFERPAADGIATAWLAVVYSGVFATGVAFTLQLLAQRDAPHTHAAVLLSLEAVFAAFFGWWLLSESLGTRELVGGGLMLAGILASQLIGKKPEPGVTAGPAPAP